MRDDDLGTVHEVGQIHTVGFGHYDGNGQYYVYKLYLTTWKDGAKHTFVFPLIDRDAEHLSAYLASAPNRIDAAREFDAALSRAGGA